MLFQTKNGRFLDDTELDVLSALEVEDLGIHAVSNQWDDWQEDN